MKAWVVSITSLEAAKSNPATRVEVVIAIMSARRSVAFMEDFVEVLANVLRRDLHYQKDLSAYHRKITRNPYVSSDDGRNIAIFDHPYLINAQHSDILSITTKNGVSWLKWRGTPYSRYAIDKATHQIVKTADVKPQLKECAQAIFDLRGLFRGR